MCSNTVLHTEMPYKKRIFRLFRQRKEEESISLHFPHAPDFRFQENYISMAKWPMVLSFPEYGTWHACAEVNTNFSLTPLKQSAWIKASSM